MWPKLKALTHAIASVGNCKNACALKKSVHLKKIIKKTNTKTSNENEFERINYSSISRLKLKKVTHKAMIWMKLLFSYNTDWTLP